MFRCHPKADALEVALEAARAAQRAALTQAPGDHRIIWDQFPLVN